MDNYVIYHLHSDLSNGVTNVDSVTKYGEYIELAKEYSGDKSYMFINGILTEILRDMKQEGTLFKALSVK